MSNLTKFFLAASVLILSSVSAANAQITSGSAVKVLVPDSFEVNDESFSAGFYTIERTPSTVDSPSLLIIRGDNGKAMLFDTLISRPSKAATETELIFDRIGGTKILSEIIVGGQPTAYRLTKTKAQKRRIAEAVSSTQVVPVANTGF